MTSGDEALPMGNDLQERAKPLSEAAKRALAEAAERRTEFDRRASELAAKREINGRGGLDPVRYQDWEVKGLTSDFS